MRLLAFDTSGEILSAAVAEDGRVLCEMENAAGTRHSAALIPLLEKLMKKARWTPGQVDVLAVGVGPGSFTGIRVGVATAKMLALVWKKPLVGVSSLEALAYASDAAVDQAPVAIDARRGMIYAALYARKNGAWVERASPALTTLVEFSKKFSGPVSVLERPVVRASAVALAAFARAKAKRVVTPDGLEPLYLRPKDCNVTKK